MRIGLRFFITGPFVLTIIGSCILILVLSGCAPDASDPQLERQELEAEAERQIADAEPETETYARDDDRSVERQIADASLAARIRLALVDEGALRPFDFEPTVVNGRVLLRGEVRTREQRSEAERVARGISGVREVVNDITATDEPALAESDPSRDSLLAQAEEQGPQETGDADPSPDAAALAASGSSAASSSDESDPDNSASSPADEAAVYHTVRSGDSLWEIAREYGVTVEQLTRLNNMQSNRLMPGQRLQVK